MQTWEERQMNNEEKKEDKGMWDMMRQTCVRREWSETEMEECENDTQGETLKQSDEEKRYKL